MNLSRFLIFSIALFASTCARTTVHPAFNVIVLGAGGGLDESNLSCYLISPFNDNRFIALDAGTIFSGIQKAELAGSFSDVKRSELQGLALAPWLMKRGIKAYLISHAHFDHTSGMIINSPDDGNKVIFGLQNTIDDLRDHVFNGKSWINFGNEGEGAISRYRLVRANPRVPFEIQDTPFRVTAFPLSHSNRGSTAFLIESNGQFALYFGDTGPDIIEKSTNMQQVWNAVAPIVREQRLRGIFLEVSYPDGKPDNQLSSHLTPKWFMRELHDLAQTVNPAEQASALKSIRVIVTHIKPSHDPAINPRRLIQDQLAAQNDLNLDFIFAEQGQRFHL
ncbi:MAG: 3',5'-cyclic-nucleotide phosphodiesterase [Spirochaetia bacterium]|nr:3',5'-cyclic-nucleotide phosphodiesterase [Spirochaetia bacterium]